MDRRYHRPILVPTVGEFAQYKVRTSGCPKGLPECPHCRAILLSGAEHIGWTAFLTPTGASIALLGAAEHNITRSQRGRRRSRAGRARAGFEIDHSEPQARVWRSRGRPGPKAPTTQAPHHNLEPRPTSAWRRGPKAPDTQAVLTDTSMSREKRGPLRTGNRVPSGGPRPAWRPPRLCRGRPGVPQPARSRGGRR